MLPPPSECLSAPNTSEEEQLKRVKRKTLRRRASVVVGLLLILGVSGALVLNKDAVISFLRGIPVDSGNPGHWFAFFVAGILFGSVLMVIPFTFYVLTCSYYLHLYAFFVVYSALVVGLFVNFAIGRYARRHHGNESSWFPRFAVHVSAVRSAFVQKPITLSFWIMFAPVPLALTHFLCARLTDVPPIQYALGAVPQKWLYYAPFVILAAYADNLADAFDSDKPERFAASMCGIGGIVVFIVFLSCYAKKELARYKGDPSSSRSDTASGSATVRSRASAPDSGDIDVPDCRSPVVICVSPGQVTTLSPQSP
eukprot:TRINITY_DN10442_c0_g2_i1.p1 TRINITY_DN10442_c0_g2~~TRINITY_DN10442_c0_g2_i1.p1  ORF type:complete len:311 (+),score=75.08 TRINITY_DN10442_c0_g2_i1:62-994(+)